MCIEIVRIGDSKNKIVGAQRPERSREFVADFGLAAADMVDRVSGDIA